MEELAELRGRIRHLGVPLAADESVRKAEDPLRVARAGAADLLVIKAQPLGGIHRALRITREAGLPVVVSSALDTSVGISMAAHLAAAIPELPHDCGLGTVSLFVEDVVAEPLVPVDGKIAVRRVSPDRASWTPTLSTRTAASGGSTGSAARTPCSPAPDAVNGSRPERTTGRCRCAGP